MPFAARDRDHSQLVVMVLVLLPAVLVTSSIDRRDSNHSSALMRVREGGERNIRVCLNKHIYVPVGAG
uniref:Putative secreted protein n=1 Tax=Anopheles darlingi TaxID=43151 RepID=A0A2M4D8D8_ANODA